LPDLSTDNVTGPGLPAAALHRPGSVAEVVQLVASARARKVALYPFSTGMNWGYGSRSPAAPGCELVDLSRMNRIRNLDRIGLDHAVAVIEPGVTQGQLHAALKQRCPGLTFNVTGSGRDTSLLGNALDRGSGYVGPRVADIFGLEVVTGTGEVLLTGSRRLGETSPLAESHPYGLGPMLDGLFSQSSFGIVTSACFKLIPRRPVEVAVSLSLHRSEDLGRLLNLVAAFKREELLNSITHVANSLRSASTLRHGIRNYLAAHPRTAPGALEAEVAQALAAAVPKDWTSLGSVTGNAGQVKSAVREIRQRVGSLARLTVVTSDRLAWAYRLCDQLSFVRFLRVRAAALAAVQPLHALALGEPTDAPVEGLLARYDSSGLAARDLDASNCGLIYVSPALPLDGEFVAETAAEMRELARQHGHELYITINFETSTSLVSVMNLLFDRRDAAAATSARRCAQALLAYLHRRGLEVYRARPDIMDEVTGRNPEYWAWIRTLKRSFDPDSIIAPGRYCPL